MNNDFMSKLVGDDGVKFSISVDMISVIYLVAGALLSGILLILISKKLIK